nr:alpha/beta hydrolase [Sphingomonas flavalba]
MALLKSAKLASAAIMLLTLSAPSLAESTTIADRTLSLDHQTFRYLSAGTEGPPIVLLHGWPQSADEFREIIPELSEYYTVYAPDLSGIGGSTAPGQDWSKEALARDIDAFINALELEDPLIVGHDIGGMVAYAYARLFPEEPLGVAILDVPVPGLSPWDTVAMSSHAWHFDFHKQTGLTENLVVGRQAEYFRYFIDSTAANPDAIPDSAIARYAEAYGTPERLRAGFELYRAFDEDAAFFQSLNEPFDVPMLVVGAEFSTQAALPAMATSYAAQGATDVTTLAIEGAGHWLPEERPQATIDAIIGFAARLSQR